MVPGVCIAEGVPITDVNEHDDSALKGESKGNNDLDFSDVGGETTLEISGGRPGMSPGAVSVTVQGPRSQVSPAAILFPQKDLWWNWLPSPFSMQ